MHGYVTDILNIEQQDGTTASTTGNSELGVGNAEMDELREAVMRDVLKIAMSSNAHFDASNMTLSISLPTLPFRARFSRRVAEQDIAGARQYTLGEEGILAPDISQRSLSVAQSQLRSPRSKAEETSEFVLVD